MKTRYIGIETIIYQNKEKVTIACDLMLEGRNYDEPIYVNIFCTYEELKKFLSLDKSYVSTEMQNDFEKRISENVEELIQIDIQEYLPHAYHWVFSTMVDLNLANEEDIPIDCYTFNEL